MAFLIGEWHLDTWFVQKDGSRRPGTAFLTARYVLGGFGVELSSRYPGTDGAPDFLGTRTYVYNSRLGQWVGAGINSLGNRKDYTVEFADGKMIVIQSGMLFNGRPGINRMTYFAIEDSSFEHTVQNSPDGGETWQESEFGFKARRIR